MTVPADGVFAFCPAKDKGPGNWPETLAGNAGVSGMCWPATRAENPGVLVDSAAVSGLIALAFRSSGGGSARLLRLDAPPDLRLQLLATLPLDMPPASIRLSTDRGQEQAASSVPDARRPGYILAVGFEEGGLEVSRIR